VERDPISGMERLDYLQDALDEATWEHRKTLAVALLCMAALTVATLIVWSADRPQWSKYVITVVMVVIGSWILIESAKVIALRYAYVVVREVQWHRVVEHKKSVVDEIIDLSPEPENPIDYHDLMKQSEAERG